jgi:hypothetical protein
MEPTSRAALFRDVGKHAEWRRESPEAPQPDKMMLNDLNMFMTWDSLHLYGQARNWIHGFTTVNAGENLDVPEELLVVEMASRWEERDVYQCLLDFLAK